MEDEIFKVPIKPIGLADNNVVEVDLDQANN